MGFPDMQNSLAIRGVELEEYTFDMPVGLGRTKAVFDIASKHSKVLLYCPATLVEQTFDSLTRWGRTVFKLTSRETVIRREDTIKAFTAAPEGILVCGNRSATLGFVCDATLVVFFEIFMSRRSSTTIQAITRTRAPKVTVVYVDCNLPDPPTGINRDFEGFLKNWFPWTKAATVSIDTETMPLDWIRPIQLPKTV